jgi:DNA repair exonuclease SbcCD ATPase subunit
MSSIQALVNQAITMFTQTRIADGLKKHAAATERETKVRAEEVISTKEERVSTARTEVENTQEALSRSRGAGQIKMLTKKLESQQKAYEEAEASLTAAKARLRGDYSVIGGKEGKVVI